MLFAGLIFILTSVTKISNKLVATIPKALISGMSAGIGFFIAFLGLKNIQGSFLIAIILGTFIGYLFGIVDVSTLGVGSLSFNGFSNLVFSFNFSQIFTANFWIAVFSLSMFIIFQGVGSQLSMLPDKNKFPKSFLANAVATTIAPVLGCCSIASAAEGATGVAAGGKTGLTSLVSGVLFIPAIFFLPLFKLIPMSAVSPILMIVGCLMVSNNIKNVNFEDFTEAFPVYLMLIIMPLSFNMADGMAFGFISYTLLKVITGRERELSKTVYGLSFLFLLYFVLGAI